MDVVGCLGCDLAAERRDPPGGRLYETSSWIVNHAIGPADIGTLAVSPREHVVGMVDLDDHSARELGFVLRLAARAVELVLRPEQVDAGLWSQDVGGTTHLLFVVQPVTSDVIARYAGLRGARPHARTLPGAHAPDVRDVELFCEDARDMVAFISLSEPDD